MSWTLFFQILVLMFTAGFFLLAAIDISKNRRNQ